MLLYRLGLLIKHCALGLIELIYHEYIDIANLLLFSEWSMVGYLEGWDAQLYGCLSLETVSKLLSGALLLQML